MTAKLLWEMELIKKGQMFIEELLGGTEALAKIGDQDLERQY